MRRVARRSADAGRPRAARGRDARRRPGDGERGSATVEAAFAVCAVIAVLALALGAGASMLAQLRCADAAREAARLVARGESERADQAARSVAPSGATITISVSGDEVTVEVSASPSLPGVRIAATAIAVLEPGVVA